MMRKGEFTLGIDGNMVMDVDKSIEPEGFYIDLKPLEGFAGAMENGITVVLDTALTPELIAEGRARELVHRIQTMRKDAGFNVEDRIVTSFDRSSELATVIGEFDSYIKQETLTELLEPDGAEQGYRWEGAIDGLAIALSVRKTSDGA